MVREVEPAYALTGQLRMLSFKLRITPRLTKLGLERQEADFDSGGYELS
jgi:hypothetical protein